jgi:hypothetical protein
VIVIHPSPTADTRTCDWSKVTKEQLLASSVQHISDIGAGLAFFAERLAEQALIHDYDKISDIDGFHADFATGFAQKGWWDKHRRVNRHHLTMEDGIPQNVNLIDVLDFIVDCVMAGMARSGSVYPLALPPELLEQAFQNTVTLLKENVQVSPIAGGAGEDTRTCKSCGFVAKSDGWLNCPRCTAAATPPAEVKP